MQILGLAANQTLGEALVHFALYVAALKELCCFGPRRGQEATLVRTDQWKENASGDALDTSHSAVQPAAAGACTFT